MKKLLALLLTMVMILSVTVVPSFASETVQDELLYKDAFVQQYIGEYDGKEGYRYSYDEVYYHRIDEADPNSKIDWVLVSATGFMCSPWYVKAVVGELVFRDVNEYHPFPFNYAVYDVGNNYFNDLTNDDFRIYDDLEEVCYELGLGQPVGDADFDDKLTIMDATYIQNVIAGLCEFNIKDNIEGYPLDGDDLDYISDMNHDGVRNIMDATAIQLRLASMDYLSTDLVIENYNEEDHPRGLYTFYGDYSVDYEPLANETGLYDKSEMNHNNDKFVALIRSQEQYFEIFGVYNERYDDEFFSTQAIIAAVTQVYDVNSYAEIADIGVDGGILYVSLKEYTEGSLSDTPTALPTAPLYFSLVAVDKELVKYVDTIEYKKLWNDGVVWSDKSKTVEHTFSNEIAFENEYIEKNNYLYFDRYRQDFVAIITSEQDYSSITKWYTVAFNKEFFETKALIMNISAQKNYQDASCIDKMEVVGNTLYVYEKHYAIDSFEQLSVPAIHHDFCIVDKADIENVTEIVLVK